MAKCVMRQEKKKTAAHIGNTDRHNSRRPEIDSRRRKDHIDPSRTHLNRRIVGPAVGGVAAVVERRCEQVREQARKLGKRGGVKHNSVRTVEFFISASPEYFRPQPGKPQLGPWDKAATQAWVEAAGDYVQREWGADLLSLDLHLDEKTPHLHALIWAGHRSGPGVLSANRNFVTKKNLVAYHDRYAEAVKALGISRADRGSGAKHIPEAEYRRQVALGQAVHGIKPPQLQSAEVVALKIGPVVTKTQAIKMAGPKTVKALAEKVNALAGELGATAAKLDQVKWRNSAQTAELAELRPIAAQVRGIEVGRVVADWQAATDKMPPPSAAKARNAIDAVKALEGCDYKTAVQILTVNYGFEGAKKTAKEQAIQRIDSDLPKMIMSFIKPRPKWADMRRKKAEQKQVEELPPWKKLLRLGLLWPLPRVQSWPDPPPKLDDLLMARRSAEAIYAYALKRACEIAAEAGVDVSKLTTADPSTIREIAAAALKTEGVSEERAEAMLGRPAKASKQGHSDEEQGQTTMSANLLASTNIPAAILEAVEQAPRPAAAPEPKSGPAPEPRP